MKFITLTNSFNGLEYKVNPSAIQMLARRAHVDDQVEETTVTLVHTQIVVKETEEQIFKLIEEIK